MVMMLDKKKVNLLLKILLFSAALQSAMRTGKEWIHCTVESPRGWAVVMMLD